MYHVAAQAIQHLSARQWEIIGLASRGFTDAAMSVRLGISEGTIGTHWSRIRAKLGPFSRTELVALGVRSELQGAMDALAMEREALRKQLTLAATELAGAQDARQAEPDGLVVFGAGQAVVYANSTMHELLGYEPGGLIGKCIGDLVPASLRQRARTELEACVDVPQVVEGILAYALRRDGTEVPVRLTRSCNCGPGRSLVVDTVSLANPAPDEVPTANAAPVTSLVPAY